MTDSDLARVWMNNPYTKKLLSKTQKDKSKALERLLRLCYESPDPAVRAAYMVYTQLSGLEQVLQGED